MVGAPIPVVIPLKKKDGNAENNTALKIPIFLVLPMTPFTIVIPKELSRNNLFKYWFYFIVPFSMKVIFR